MLLRWSDLPFGLDDFDKNLDISGPWYIDTPVANLIRSTHQAGDVIVRVKAEGLKTGTVKLKSVVEAHPASPITVVPLLPDGRMAVARKPGFEQPMARVQVLERRSGDNVRFASGPNQRDEISAWVATLHASPVPDDAAFRSLVRRIHDNVLRTGGELIMETTTFRWTSTTTSDPSNVFWQIYPNTRLTKVSG
ncbi:MAG: hypothetical protein LR015_07830 [Verrucomicrobia bacterium]|nr:hypothetical protein [Verrucomicrobiota bacterium]